LEALGLVDRVLEEPLGGAHRDPVSTAATVKEALCDELRLLNALSAEDLKRVRYERLMGFGIFDD